MLDVYLLVTVTAPSEVVAVEDSALFPISHLFAVVVLSRLGSVAEEEPIATLVAVDISLLEIGAGNGFCSLTAAALPGPRSVLATDISKLSLELLR